MWPIGLLSRSEALRFVEHLANHCALLLSERPEAQVLGLIRLGILRPTKCLVGKSGEGVHVSGGTCRADDTAPVLNVELGLQCHAQTLTNSQGVLPVMLLALRCLGPPLTEFEATTHAD